MWGEQIIEYSSQYTHNTKHSSKMIVPVQNSNCAPPSVSVIQTYRIFVELFFLMGVNWISEVHSSC